MPEKIKEAFSQIRAEEALMISTREFLSQKTRGYTAAVKGQLRVCAAACACLLFLMTGGHFLYFVPTSEIGIDINPSFELGVNRFGRIISFQGRNDDGRELAGDFDIKYEKYADALDQILENEKIAGLLSGDEIMTITVTGRDESQSAQILSEIEISTARQGNTHCYFVSAKEAEEAHHAGLTCGKYRAFLEIQTLDPDITPEFIQGMTMREIRDLIDALSPDSENGGPSDCGRNGICFGQGSGHRGRYGNGHGCRSVLQSP